VHVIERLAKGLLNRIGLDIRRVSRLSLPQLIEARFEDVRFPFWIANEHAAAWGMTKPVRRDSEMVFLERVAKPGAIVLEVGAHHGMHTLQLARWVGPSGQVHAFEMNRANTLTLAANAGINRLTNVWVRRYAVGEATGILEEEGEHEGQGAGSCPAITLDEYLAAQELPRVDLLKIDVEGYEGRVLAGASRVLAMRPHVDLELHLDELPRYGNSLAEILSRFEWSEYEATVMIRPDWFTEKPYAPGDDLPRTGVVNLFLRACRADSAG